MEEEGIGPRNSGLFSPALFFHSPETKSNSPFHCYKSNYRRKVEKEVCFHTKEVLLSHDFLFVCNKLILLPHKAFWSMDGIIIVQLDGAKDPESSWHNFALRNHVYKIKKALKKTISILHWGDIRFCNYPSDDNVRDFNIYSWMPFHKITSARFLRDNVLLDLKILFHYEMSSTKPDLTLVDTRKFLQLTGVRQFDQPWSSLVIHTFEDLCVRKGPTVWKITVVPNLVYW